MNNLDDLERLERLRHSGTLTESEFENQKRVILNRPKITERFLIATSSVLFVALIVSWGYIIFNRQPNVQESEQDREAPPQLPVSAGLQTTPSATTTGPAGSDRQHGEGSFEWATDVGRIGENPAYLEKILGPPVTKGDRRMRYTIGGCRVSYVYDNSEIIYLQSEISKYCNVDFFGTKISPYTKISSIYSGIGTFRTLCLANCGNAYDPTIDLFVPGPHANGFIDIEYTLNFDESYNKGRELWQNFVMQRAGVTNLSNASDSETHCVSQPPRHVISVLLSSTVSDVKIGRNFDEYGCKFSE